MADLKISQLTGSTTPLAGTETLPIVQSSTTKKVSVADLTAGRSISALNIGLGTTSPLGALDARSSNGVIGTMNTSTAVVANTAQITLAPASAFTGAWATGPAVKGVLENVATYATSITINPYNGSTGQFESVNYDSLGNATIKIGNLIQGTAAKGINFTANTPAAGMTSQLLNWYEEGTWTPNQGAGLTLIGAFSSTGTYTRIGRQVMVRGQVAGATSVAVSASGVISSNLPFTAAVTHAGSMINDAVNSSGVVQITSTSVVAADAIAATLNITFTAIYTV